MDLKAWELRRGLLAHEAEREARDELKKLTEAQKQDIRRGKIHYLREETREGWTGSLPFYLFYCSSCERFYKDYKHGFQPHVTCYRCGTHYDLEPQWRIELAKLRDVLRLTVKTRFGRDWKALESKKAENKDEDIEILN